MDSTPDRDHRRAKGAWSNWRRWAILLGALILFAVVFDLLERLVEPEPRQGVGVASNPASSLEPIRPEVTKVGSTGVRVTVEEGGHRYTRNCHDEAKADRMIACVEEGIATSPALTEGEAGQPPESDDPIARTARANQVWMEMIRILNDCLVELDLTPPDDRPWRI
jgi:hypothetical protein